MTQTNLYSFRFIHKEHTIEEAADLSFVPSKHKINFALQYSESKHKCVDEKARQMTRRKGIGFCVTYGLAVSEIILHLVWTGHQANEANDEHR